MEQSEAVVQSPGKLATMRDFLVDTRTEMEKVSWPAKPELVKATRAVIIGSIVLGLVIGFVDKLLSLILVDGVAALVR
ncbi:MAG: preprotein translocase subunit SecE [Gemmatimonadales bacterium]|nr:preprotein translocase subunit SecE [Gemmatimonadales bacterium]MDZ4388290.1 preprotein translocase subunit SecE [Gemmatimonadales bacterium]